VLIVRFLWGAVNGEWASLDTFSIAAVYDAARLTTAMIGVATVWLTWRLARDLSGSRAVALLAAAQLAVRSLHVRESHYALTDVPAALLTTVALWLAYRASRPHTWRAYAWAGAFCGLAAAAKYTGGVVLVAPLVTWALYERSASDRGRTAAAMLGAAALAFAVAAPYTLLDMPAFLDGFAKQFARFAAPKADGTALWITYLKHLSPAGLRWWVPLAAAGVVDVLWRRRRTAWLPLLAFAGAFFYVLSSHAPAFARYALPLVPLVCILSSVAIVELIRVLTALPFLARPAARNAVAAALVLLVIGAETADSVDWLNGLRRVDTRTMAAEWLKNNAAEGARVAVENSGPTYLGAAGFRVVGTQSLTERPPDWLAARADYLVMSSADLSAYGAYIAAGDIVFQVAPTPQRWGPPIQIVKLRR
jgi:hypothetical protein